MWYLTKSIINKNMKKILTISFVYILIFATLMSHSTIHAEEPEELIATVTCLNNEYTGTITTSTSQDGTIVILEFSPALPDEDCCTIQLNGYIEDSFLVRTLRGDLNRDGHTNPVDSNIILLRFGMSAPTAGPEFDFNVDGEVNPGDKDMIIQYFGNKVSDCSNSPSTIIAARSYNTHGDYGELYLNLFESNVEPRLPGVTKIEFTLNKLEINLPQTSVLEGSDFTVSLTEKLSGISVIGAGVTFNGVTEPTNDNGQCVFTAPVVDTTSEYIIKASKDGYVSAEDATITVNDKLQLVIGALSSVTVDDSFDVSVTSENLPIDDVEVTFDDKTEYTEDGIVTFTADSAGTFTITASTEEYSSATTEITVLDPTGWVWGVVYDIDSGDPIRGAEIAILISPDTTITTFTNENGQYVKSVPVGTYTIEASKEGYETSKDEVIIKDGVAENKNFYLKEIEDYEPEPSIDDTLDTGSDLIDTVVRSYARSGIVSAKIKYTSSDNPELLRYSDKYTIKLNPSDDPVSIIISAEDGSPGTILVFFISPDGVLEDLNNIEVDYDGDSIPEFTDIEEFFDLEDNKDLGWIRALTTAGLYVFVRVPEWSTHTISITSIEVVVNIIAIVTFYVAFFIIATTVFLSRFYARPIFLLRRHKK